MPLPPRPPLQKIAPPKWPKDFSLRATARRIIGYSADFRGWARQNRGRLLRSFQLLHQHYLPLLKGKKISDNAAGILLEQKSTGSAPGFQNRGVFKATLNGRAFFIKVTRPEEIGETLNANKEWAKIIQAHRGRINGFTLEILTPHLVYSGKMKLRDIPLEEGFIIYDFLDADRVVQAVDVRGPKKTQIAEALLELRQWHHQFILGWGNTFFEPKTNKLILFDLTG